MRSGADGAYGPATEQATRAFQGAARINPDGAVGPMTFAAAIQRGFDPGFSDPHGGDNGIDWPPRPAFPPMVSNAERAQVFGLFSFEPLGENTDDIRILGGWQQDNIAPVTIDQLVGVKGAPANGRIHVHKLVVEQMRQLFAAWQAAGLVDRMRTWEGSFAPRFVRGGRPTLSNHAWGTAFDINFQWNRLATVPALRGEEGSVRELVPIANEHGFFWGGHFSRCDGMHFEVAQPRQA